MEMTEPMGNGHMSILIKSIFAQMCFDWCSERESFQIIPTVTSDYKLAFPRPRVARDTQDFLASIYCFFRTDSRVNKHSTLHPTHIDYHSSQAKCLQRSPLPLPLPAKRQQQHLLMFHTKVCCGVVIHDRRVEYHSDTTFLDMIKDAIINASCSASSTILH